MSRIFKRPMFRKGGNVGEGIMTGIVDREMHAVSDPDGVGGKSNRERIMEAYDKYPSQDFDPLTQFLLQYGPAAATQTGGGGTIGNLLAAGKEPIADLIKNRGAENKFKRKIAMEGEILDIEGDIKKDVAGIQQKGALDIRIGKLDELYDIKRKQAGGNQVILDQIEKDYQRDFRDAVQGLDESDLYGVLKNTVVQEALMDNARSIVENQMKLDSNDPRYGAAVSQVLAKLSKKYISDLRSNNANGGRIGYANGTPPTMNQGMNPDMNQTPVNVGSQEVSDPKIEITYEELRSRLPEEINNEVVQMLSTSYEALADFAELRTQADVDTFNSKYGVTLVLPQEA